MTQGEVASAPDAETGDDRGNHTYAGAIEWLEKVRPLFGRLSREDEFDELVEELRRRHRAKRNLMKRLDEQGWGVLATERAADARSANNAPHS